MSLKAWIIRKEKDADGAFAFLLAQQLAKQNASEKIRIWLDALVFLLGTFCWKLRLRTTHFLNTLRETSLLLAVRKAGCRHLPFLKRYCYECALPANLRQQDAHLFANNFYFLKPLQIFHLRNYSVRITAFSGIVFCNFHIFPASIHGWWTRTRKTVFRNYYRETMGAWLQSRYAKEQTIERLPAETGFLLIHHWFNYYHWFTESLARLWVVRERIHDYTLLLPAYFQTQPFVMQTLQALGVKKIRWIQEGAVLQVPQLTVVENKPYCNHYDPVLVKAMGQFFRDYATQELHQPADYGEKIFITRKKAARRKLMNEAEIEGVLAENGFRMIAIEEYPLLEEIAIMSKAKYLIGMHGAGLTNMLFMPPGGKVLELHREVLHAGDLHSDVYWKLASALGHSYFYQFCKSADPNQNFFEADYRIDIALFKENLLRMLAG